MSALFEIRNSPIAGVGVFAIAPIKQGQSVHFMVGVRCTLDDVIKLVHDGSEAASDPFQIDDSTFLDLEERSRSFNHSCQPNLYVRGENEMVALRDIEVTEELTFDYATTMKYDAEKIISSGHELWTCVCCCGKDNCRGEINEFKTLPADIQAYYISNRYMPDYLLKHYV